MSNLCLPSAISALALFAAATSEQIGVALAQETGNKFAHDLSTIEKSQAEFDWAMQCQGCHGVDGVGSELREVPSLTGEVSKFLLVKGGREFLVRVPGVSGAPISDERLANVLNWMLITMDPEHLQSDEPKYTPEEVSIQRKKVLRIDVFERRAELIGKIKEYLEETN